MMGKKSQSSVKDRLSFCIEFGIVIERYFKRKK